MIEGWEWCITHQNDDPANPIMIISTSFGSERYYGTCDSASPGMTAAAANAVSAGMTLFVSSGNDGYCDSMSWPACISHVNSVGAVYDASLGTWGFCLDSAQTCAETQVYNACAKLRMKIAWDTTVADLVTSYSNSASFLDLFAPSHNAFTTDITGTGGYSSGDYSTNFGGTSAACPYAAGAAACLQSANKAKNGVFMTPAQVKSKLIDYGDLITDEKASITKPRINLGNSIASITIEDIDNDGIADGVDNCPDICNTHQLDSDGDGIGDVCDDTPACDGCGLDQCEQEC
jgi:subtilisin family serine protease